MEQTNTSSQAVEQPIRETVGSRPIPLNEKRRICGLPPIDGETADVVMMDR